MTPAKVGRNQWCPCGSGRKYKHCHGVRSEQMSLGLKIALLVAAGAVLAGVLMGISSFNTEPSSPTGGVWSEEHNHYH
jgi:hypothetical protein